jgi:arsenate reductase (thioredoxin)
MPTGLSLDQQQALDSAAANLSSEFAGIFGTETITAFLESSYDQFAGNARFPDFLALFAERFARQRLRALAKIEGKGHDGVPIVLFLCVHNAGRSQMALGWFEHLAGEAGPPPGPAAPSPGEEVNPAAVHAMAEVGIDITG